MHDKGHDLALIAYEKFAPVYDEFTAGYQAETWTKSLEAKAARWMLTDRPSLFLDVGCGTGKSLLPMVNRGWEVVGSDFSSGMLKVAKAKVINRVQLHHADVRTLPAFGEFDLVWAINHTLNYMMSNEELAAALVGMKRNLSRGGVLLFDLSTLRSMHEWFSEERISDLSIGKLRWQGLTTGADAGPDLIWRARVELPSHPAANHVHQQRHFSQAVVRSLMSRVGLDCLDVWGDLDGTQDQPANEEHHERTIYIARRQ